MLRHLRGAFRGLSVSSGGLQTLLWTATFTRCRGNAYFDVTEKRLGLVIGMGIGQNDNKALIGSEGEMLSAIQRLINF